MVLLSWSHGLGITCRAVSALSRRDFDGCIGSDYLQHKNEHLKSTGKKVDLQHSEEHRSFKLRGWKHLAHAMW